VPPQCNCMQLFQLSGSLPVQCRTLILSVATQQIIF